GQVSPASVPDPCRTGWAAPLDERAESWPEPLAVANDPALAPMKAVQARSSPLRSAKANDPSPAKPSPGGLALWLLELASRWLSAEVEPLSMTPGVPG